PQSTITCPAGATNLSPGDDIDAIINRAPSGTSFCVRAGIHYLSAHIVPKSGQTIVGEFGAVIDGSQMVPRDPMDDAIIWGSQTNAGGVTIRNLVVRNLTGGHYVCVAVYNNPLPGWTIEHNELANCQIGVVGGVSTIIRNNSIHDNIQYGVSGYQSSGVTVQNNEFFRNYLCLCHPSDGGASKFVGTSNNSFIGNYIHDNGGNGIWFDTKNTGVLIDGNTVSVNMKYGKAISMEQNNGPAVIRNNTITVGSGGEVAIRLNNSSNVQIHNNTITTASLSGGGAINVFFDASRTGWDTANNQITNNTISLQGSATIIVGVTCSNVSDCSPYWTTKGNLFQGNTYHVPSWTGRNWALSSSVAWPTWQAVGFDTTGSLVP
ncbi:MAG: right-handed parallel beta-helix repeat-containing protein, partial [Gaiellales bacterium]